MKRFQLLRGSVAGPIVFGLFVLMASGCSTIRGPQADDPYFAPATAPEPEPDFANAGGIAYARFGNSLFSDAQARHVGDILTVNLIESTSASKTADTEITKESGLTMNEGLLLGKVPGDGDYNLESQIDQSREFNGESDSQQTNFLNGKISVTVTKVYPNGLLAIRGEKWMRLNRGDEYIRISGLVRWQDISPQNTIASTRIANARISYSGTGELAASNRMGWASRFFSSVLWPF